MQMKLKDWTLELVTMGAGDVYKVGEEILGTDLEVLT
jgi:hypothetical protein